MGPITLTMTSSYGNIFRATGPLWEESTGHRWIPLTKASDAELWCYLWSGHEQTVEQTIDGDLKRHRANYDVTVMILRSGMPCWPISCQAFQKQKRCLMMYQFSGWIKKKSTQHQKLQMLMPKHTGVSVWICRLTSIWIPVLKIRRSSDRLIIFNMALNLQKIHRLKYRQKYRLSYRGSS